MQVDECVNLYIEFFLFKFLYMTIWVSYHNFISHFIIITSQLVTFVFRQDKNLFDQSPGHIIEELLVHCWCMISQGMYFCLKVQMATGGNTDQNEFGYQVWDSRVWGLPNSLVLFYKCKTIDYLLCSCNALFCDCFEFRSVSVPYKLE